MRIGIIVHWMNPNMVEMVRLLKANGVKLEVISPQENLTNLANIRVQHDLYVLKSGNDLALSIGGILHELGAATVNPYPVVALLQNKIVTTRLLQTAGVPVPETYVTVRPRDLIPQLDDGPLIIKPFRGCRGEGIKVVWNADDLDKLTLEGPVMAQRFYQSDDGLDQKIFCIGGRLFGVRRIFPLRSYEDKMGEPFTLSSELREIARRCGELIGTDLFGVDVVISKGRPYVVDLNKFCSFIGVQNAPRLLADYVLNAAKRALRGESLLMSPAGRKVRPESSLENPPSPWGLPEGHRHPVISEGATS